MAAFWITVVSAAIAGLLLGSFLNVCIARLPAEESVVSPRSRCLQCGHSVRWFDNIPVLSFLLLKGKCRDCGRRISWQYPAIEIATAIWFALSFLESARMFSDGTAGTDLLFRTFIHGTADALLGFFLFGLLVMDWQTGLLPNEFTIGGTLVGLFFTTTESFFLPAVSYKTFLTPEESFISGRVEAALLGFVLLWLIGFLYRRIRRRPGMGLGDAKLLAMIGSFLGLAPTLLAFVLGVFLAGFAAIFLLAGRRATGASRLPFGSYLCIGGLIAALAGSRIVGTYLALFH